jgi:hypothetical protein
VKVQILQAEGHTTLYNTLKFISFLKGVLGFVAHKGLLYTKLNTTVNSQLKCTVSTYSLQHILAHLVIFTLKRIISTGKKICYD